MYQGPSLKAAGLSLHSRGSWSMNWLKSGNWLRGCDSLFLWFELDSCSLDLELFCLYKSSKNLVGFLSISFLGTPGLTSQRQRSDYFNCRFDSSVQYGNHAHFVYGGWVPSLDPCYPEIQLLPLHLGVPVEWLLPTLRSSLQRRVIIELLKHAGLFLQTGFSKYWWKVCLLDPPSEPE